MTAATTHTFRNVLLKTIVFSRILSLVSTKSSNIGLNTVQLIEKHGYVCETHYITTEDGYILTYHRIPHGTSNSKQANKTVALLMHGISASSANYVNVSPDRSLGYLLADQGYDVWIANARGNSWSRNHTTLDADKDAEKFFDFSWHEMGYYDLPASIDHILNTTEAKTLHFVGHSQGGTAFLVLAATRPEYNSKFRLASLMAPGAFMEHRQDAVKDLSQNIYLIETMLKTLQIYEVPYVEMVRDVTRRYCGNRDTFSFACKGYFNWMGGGDDDLQLDEELMPVIATNVPSTAAVKQFIHFGQLIKNGGFRFFDYGAARNLVKYGSLKPPEYKLSRISTPVAVYYARNDGIIPMQDVKTLIRKLPNVVHTYEVPYDSFNHNDFTFAKDVVSLLFKDLISVMTKYN